MRRFMVWGPADPEQDASEKVAPRAPKIRRPSSACCFLRRHDPFRFEGSSGRAHRNLSLPRKTPLQARPVNTAWIEQRKPNIRHSGTFVPQESGRGVPAPCRQEKSVQITRPIRLFGRGKALIDARKKGRFCSKLLGHTLLVAIVYSPTKPLREVTGF